MYLYTIVYLLWQGPAFGTCVLSALSGNANENPSTDKVRRAINWGNVQSLPPPMQCCFCLLSSRFLATSAVKTLSGFHLCHQCYHCYWFSSSRNTLLLLLLLLTLLLRIHSRDPQRFQRLLLLFGLLLFKLLLVWMPDLLSWYWIIVAMLLHISCPFVRVCFPPPLLVCGSSLNYCWSSRPVVPHFLPGYSTISC